jgi:putative nucleotidyltransferase with HDIG domain
VNAHDYVSFPLSKLYADEPLPADLYLFVSGHFLKYKPAGDVIDKQKYDLFLFKGIQYVFVTNEDHAAYDKWSKDLEEVAKEELITIVGVENEALVEMHMEVQDELLNFVTSEVTDEGVKKMLDKTRAIVQKATVQKAVESFMTKILKYNDSLKDHSSNVANLSTYLALNIGYAQQILLENIYIGGLLHDFGKVRINKKYLEDPSSKSYKMAMRKHPSLGKTALLVDSSFPDEILRIIEEHHERFDGRGYPKKTKGSRHYDLSKIVQIANIFDNLVSSNKEGTIVERQRKAVKRIEKEGGKMFDPKILPKVVKALNYIIAG